MEIEEDDISTIPQLPKDLSPPINRKKNAGKKNTGLRSTTLKIRLCLEKDVATLYIIENAAVQ